MSTTPSGRSNTILCVVILFYRIFSAWIDTFVALEGWLTVVSASISPFIRGPIPFWEFIGPLFTILVRRFVVKKMHDRGNLSLHELS
jgi:hypothetical protein